MTEQPEEVTKPKSKRGSYDNNPTVDELHEAMKRLPADEQAELLALEKETPSLAHEVEELEVEGEGSWLRGLLLNPKTLISFAAAFVILFFLFTSVFQSLDLSKVAGYLGQVNIAYFGLAFGVYYAAFLVRGLRWQIFLRNAGVQSRKSRVTQRMAAIRSGGSWTKAEDGKASDNGSSGLVSSVLGEKDGRLPSVFGLIEALYLSWFVNCIVPAKLGDAYRSFLLKRDYNISFSRSIGTIFAERIMDVIVLFSLLVISGLFIGSRLLQQSSALFILGGVLVVIIVVGLVVLFRKPDLVLRFLPKRVHDLFNRFRHATVTSFKRRTLPQILILSGMVWLMESARLFFVISAFDAHETNGKPIGLSIIIFLALASSLLTTLPITAGGLGFVEGAMIGVLSLVMDPSQAAAITFLDRIINYWSIVLFGIVVYIISTARHSRQQLANKKSGGAR